jgi:hypothetical protein
LELDTWSPVSVPLDRTTFVSHFPFLLYNTDLDLLVDQPEASLDFLNRWISGEWF